MPHISGSYIFHWVLVFHREIGSNIPKNHYKNSEIEVIDKYVYLRVQYSKSSLFINATNNVISQMNVSNGLVCKILSKIKCKSWTARVTLFKAILQSTLLYYVTI